MRSGLASINLRTSSPSRGNPDLSKSIQRLLNGFLIQHTCASISYAELLPTPQAGPHRRKKPDGALTDNYCAFFSLGIARYSEIAQWLCPSRRELCCAPIFFATLHRCFTGRSQRPGERSPDNARQGARKQP